jgi:hypothetical protein
MRSFVRFLDRSEVGLDYIGVCDEYASADHTKERPAMTFVVTTAPAANAAAEFKNDYL